MTFKYFSLRSDSWAGESKLVSNNSPNDRPTKENHRFYEVKLLCKIKIDEETQTTAPTF